MRAVIAATLLATAACGGADETRPAPRLVVLYAPCSLGTEFLTPYGAAAESTPNLAAFASESVVFERHHTESGQSGIAYASLFSGRQAPRHGVFHHPTLLADDLELIAEAFAAGGYETWFWSGQGMGGARMNYGQGVAPERVFRRQKDDHAGLTANDADFDALLDALARDPTRRAYVQINFTLTHSPYQKHLSEEELADAVREVAAALEGVSEADVTRLLALYSEHRLDLQWDGPDTIDRLGLAPEELARLTAVLEAFYARNVRALDAWFGQFLVRIAERGLADESVVAFTADHGEVLYRESALFRWTHGYQLAPEVLHVPLIVRAPGVAPGRYAGVTRSVDVFPTLAGLAGLAPNGLPTTDGEDLAPALRAREGPPVLHAYVHTAVISAAQSSKQDSYPLRDGLFPASDPTSMWVGRRDDDLFYQLRRLDGEHWRVSLFDLARDPGLERDLFDESDPEHARVAERLASYKAQLVEAYEHFAALPGRDLSLRDQLRKLRELGYVR